MAILTEQHEWATQKKARPDTFHEIFLVVFWMGSFCHGLFIKIPYITGVGNPTNNHPAAAAHWDLGYGVLWTPKKSKIHRESRGISGTWKEVPAVARRYFPSTWDPLKPAIQLPFKKMVYTMFWRQLSLGGTINFQRTEVLWPFAEVASRSMAVHGSLPNAHRP